MSAILEKGTTPGATGCWGVVVGGDRVSLVALLEAWSLSVMCVCEGRRGGGGGGGIYECRAES